MQKKLRWLDLALAFGVLLGLSINYHHILLSPGTKVLGSSEDALKNYYTPWYHAQHDPDFIWFEGMNYPYGEHPVFADAQPLVSNAIKLLGLGSQTVAILNLLMLLSLIPTALLLKRILQFWEVDEVWASLSALAISLLSPQLLRMGGHFALAYTFVVPLIWYLSLRFWQNPHWKFSLGIFLSLFLSAWMHPYYLMISLVFLTAFWAIQSILNWKEMKISKRVWHMGIQLLLPAALFFLLIQLSDPVTDRPANPYGFEEYHASWRTLFLPFTIYLLSQPFFDWQTPQDGTWEGIGYVGISGGLIFAVAGLLLLSFLVRRWVLKQEVRLLPMPGGLEKRQKLLWASLLTGLAIGLFACGFPFAIKPELMTTLFPPIKQFRSLGRFAWAFYYVWSVFAFYLLFRFMQWAKGSAMRIPAILIATLLLSSSLAEGYLLNKGIVRRANRAMEDLASKPNEDLFAPASATPWLAKIDPEKYAAFILLPYFHVGSENIATNSSAHCSIGFRFSLQTGMPMMNVMMSRSSLSQSWSHLQYITESLRPLEVLAHLKDDRPILVLDVKGLPRKVQSPIWWPEGEILHEDALLKVYAIHLLEKGKLIEGPRVSLDSTWRNSTEGWLKRGEDGTTDYQDFEQDGDAEGYGGGKGKTLMLKDNNLIFKGILEGENDRDYLVSFWAKLKADQLPITNLGLEEPNASGENLQWIYTQMGPDIVMLDGEWALVERTISAKDAANEIKLNITRWKRRPPTMIIDKVLIRPKNMDILMLEKGSSPAMLNLRPCRVMEAAAPDLP